MKKFKSIKISKPAEKDLKNIASYTSKNWVESQKDKYLGLFKQFLVNLSQNDEAVLALLKVRDEIESGVLSYRIEKHVDFLRLTQREIFVIRVLHASMDAERHLGD